MDILFRIKRCALARQVRFTHKATDERIFDDLTEMEILESLVNATRIDKRIRSTRLSRRGKPDYLYIIKSPTAHAEWV